MTLLNNLATSAGCRQRKRKTGLENVLGTIALMALVIGGVSVVGYLFTQQSDLFSASSIIEIKNLNAIRSGDELRITANVKNIGTTSISGIEINRITVGEKFSMSDQDCTGGDCLMVKIGTDNTWFSHDTANSDHSPSDDETVNDGAKKAKPPIISGVKGFAVQGDSDVSLDGGGSVAIQVILESTDTAHKISDNIRISDRLSLQLGYTSGIDVFISDVYDTRVRPG